MSLNEVSSLAGADQDEEIRKLELSNSPIDDEAMHQLKHERSELKDSLYQRILNAEK